MSQLSTFPLLTFKELRVQRGITLAQISKASFINEKRIRAFEETNATSPDVFDALLSALSNIVDKQCIRQDIFFVPALRSWPSERPLEGPLPERPTLRELLYQYQLDTYLIHLAADIPFRYVEEMLIGRPMKRELVEKALQVISLYPGESYTTENVAIVIEE